MPHYDYDASDLHVIGLLGMAITEYDGAAQDVIALLQHSKDEVRLAAVGACAILSLTDALPLLRENADILTQQTTADEETNNDEDNYLPTEAMSPRRSTRPGKFTPSFGEDLVAQIASEQSDTDESSFISENPDIELTAVQFTRAFLGDSVPFSLMEIVTTQMGEGLIGFLGCCLPMKILQYVGEATSSSFLELGNEIVSLEFLNDLFHWGDFFLVPHFWHRLVAKDLEQVDWLDLTDRQALLASLPLMLVQFYAETNELTPPSDLPNSTEAMQQFSRQLGVENNGEYVVNRVASIVQNLVTALAEKMVAFPFVRSDKPITLQSPEQYLYSNEGVTLSWEMLQERIKEVVHLHYSILTTEQTSDSHIDETDFFSFLLLMLTGEKYILANFNYEGIDLTGTPDSDFFAELKKLGKYLLIYEAVYMWGSVMVRLLQKMYGDTELGSAYWHSWIRRLSALGSVFEDKEVEPEQNGRSQKQNPIASLFEPFDHDTEMC